MRKSVFARYQSEKIINEDAKAKGDEEVEEGRGVLHLNLLSNGLMRGMNLESSL